MSKFYKLLIPIISILLASFFLYKGINKHWLSPCKIYGTESTIPLYYQQVITAFCQSGFLKLVSVFQILSAILLFFPKTRLIGAIILLPVIFNIFMIHLFLDNRPMELVESGIPMMAVIFIILTYFKKVKTIIE